MMTRRKDVYVCVYMCLRVYMHMHTQPYSLILFTYEEGGILSKRQGAHPSVGIFGQGCAASLCPPGTVASTATL